jgi:putative ABC transport system ATP-binding protein
MSQSMTEALLRRPAQSDKPLIELKEVDKIYHTPAGEFIALQGISATFYQGEFVSVVGKSGSGKSTLANMITGIDHPTRGSVQVAGAFVHEMSEGQTSVWRGRNLGIVFQFFQLLPMLTVLENTLLPMDFCHMYAPGERQERAMALLARAGLQDFAHQYPSELSGGQQQSAAVARALANDPPILIADEPTGNLDSQTAETVFQLFTELVQQGKTILMVTHDAGLAARTSRMLLLSDGQLVDPCVAAAFPDLPHPHLLRLSHLVTKCRFQDGETIFRSEAAHPGLLIVTSGEAVLRLEYRGKEDTTEILTPGQHLSNLELQSLPAKASLHAAGGPVEALVLDEDAFRHWLNESPPTQERLNQAAQLRAKAWYEPHPSPRRRWL